MPLTETARAFDPIEHLAADLSLPTRSVEAVVRLLGEGATVPFVARYRKEATGNLDEEQIRAVQERHQYLVELDKRKRTVLETIESQGKLTPALRAQIEGCATKTALEDLYLPYRPKRRTRATKAREKGLEPLAEQMLAQQDTPAPLQAAASFVSADKGVAAPEDALAGARDIVAEQLAERPEVRRLARDHFTRTGVLLADVLEDRKGERTKFEAYYGFREPMRDIPSHRFLAVRRGEKEGVLRTRLEVDPAPVVQAMLDAIPLREASPWREHLVAAAEDGYSRLVAPSVETDVRTEAKTRADRQAIEVFAENLRNLLLAPPYGQHPVVGIDPGLRTGCKCAAVDATGKYLDTVTIYPHQSEGRRQQAREALLAFLRRHSPDAVAVGNGTAGRETEAFVREVLAQGKAAGTLAREPLVLLVSESGASVYSASPVAREEFPDLDLTIRGAISIARRLQDPLAELVKIDPKSIGVGQYQHDVNPALLKRKLADVVESCVNRVGVEVNTASASLLSHVAGIGPALAKRIVAHREKAGAFRSRASLREVPGLGPRAFEQAAGFLRVRGGEHPLDASGVHPERYDLVGRMAEDLGVSLDTLVGNPTLAERINLDRYVFGDVGLPTLRDILAELKKPGRDPRDQFEAPRFREDVHTLEDLTPGMELEGVVTNVTHFGAFVDIGVKQDGLVHVSQLADRFVRDPAEVARVGDRLTVRVLEVDLERKRISLTCRSDPADSASRPNRSASHSDRGRSPRGRGGPRRDPGGPRRDRNDSRRDRSDSRRERNDSRRERNDSRRKRNDSRRERNAGKGEGLRYNPFADLLK